MKWRLYLPSLSLKVKSDSGFKELNLLPGPWSLKILSVIIMGTVLISSSIVKILMDKVNYAFFFFF